MTSSNMIRREVRIVCEKLTEQEIQKYSLHKLPINFNGKQEKRRNCEFPCGLCSKRFKGNGGLKYHIIAAHTREKTYVCHFCNKEFIRKSDLERHQRRTHLQERNFACPANGCERRFFNGIEMRSHSSRKHGIGEPIKKQFKCAFCTKSYVSKTELTTHVSIHTGEKPYSCKLCSFVTRHDDYLKLHIIRNHKKNEMKQIHSCSICQKTFVTAVELRSHYKVHTKEKPYTCAYCNKSFSSKINLKTHMMIHTGEKPFPCKLCHKEFRQLTHLKSHIRNHTGEVIFKCAQCGQTFNEVGYLKEHELIHTGEKPLSCKICGKAYRTLRVLRRHEITHGKKKFGCDECNRKYFHRHDLVDHKRLTHNSIETRRTSEF